MDVKQIKINLSERKLSGPGPDVRLPVVPVCMFSTNHCYMAEVYALLDGGSDTNLCSQRVADLLDLDGPTRDLQIQTADGTVREFCSRLLSFNVRGMRILSILLS